MAAERESDARASAVVLILQRSKARRMNGKRVEYNTLEHAEFD